MANIADNVIKIALNEVGYLEKKSNSQLDNKTANAGSNNYTKYARDLDNISGFYNGKKNGFAWCDVFVDWCFVQAFGVDKAKDLLCQPNNSLGAGCGYSARYYKNKGQFYTKNPKRGDQIFFWDSGKSGVAHTGIVYEVDNSYVYTIEGNTSSSSGVVANGGAVEKKKYSLSYNLIYGYGRPKYDTTEQAPTLQTPTVASRSYLMRGDKGAEVKAMQEKLIQLGYSCGSTGADGNFGYNTEAGLKKFQKENRLAVDGRYGNESKAKAEYLLKQKSTTTSSRIDTVKEVQEWANINYKSGLIVDGMYGTLTKRALVKILQTTLNQKYNSKLDIDGIWGNKTRNACPTLIKGANGNIVKVLQALLVCNGYSDAYVDGNYGSGTYNSVKLYQRKSGLAVDGMAGKNTFAKLCS